ncbi:Cloroperoxidase [Heliocybe sulcata]|uniref:Cloroperoxidase n=1 Tax=Heliocybe sulcata TaxID=5364 RepID=A0A5C3N391_9AGAM|nr:Cloroperoxidase [Heliocybe sulcata]
MASVSRLSRTASVSLKSLLTISLLVFLLALVSQARHPHASSTSNAFTGAHAFIPPSASDSRAPCPALNTLANHGYLPRDGKNITPGQLVSALKSAYGTTTPLAWVLTYGGYFLLRNPPPPTSLPHPSLSSLSPSSLSHFMHIAKSLPTMHKVLEPFDLADLALHNHIEHDASLAHSNAAPHDLYAPTATNATLLSQLFTFVTPNDTFTLSSIAKARVLREYQTGDTIDSFHAEVARGEVALVLGIFGTALTDIGNLDEAGGEGIPMELFESWFGENRLPAGWKPKHEQTLLGTVKISKALKDSMTKIGKDGVTEAPAPVGEKKEQRPAPIIISPLLNTTFASSSLESLLGFDSEYENLLNETKSDYDYVVDDIEEKIASSLPDDILFTHGSEVDDIEEKVSSSLMDNLLWAVEPFSE